MDTPTVATAKLALAVVYNGLTKPLTYNAHEHGHALFEKACHAFGIPEREREPLALYLPDNTTEVPPNVSLEQGGVKPDTTLILRPRRAGGG